MANIDNYSFKRNETPADSKQSAISLLKNNASGKPDGSILLARYTEDSKVKTIIGVIGTDNNVTIIEDLDSISTKANGIQSELDTTQVGAGLKDNGEYSANTSATYISLASSLVDADNKLDAELKNEVDARKSAIESLDYKGVTQTGQAIINVTEENGVINATQGDIDAVHVTVADANNKLTASTVESAIEEIIDKVNNGAVSISAITQGEHSAYASQYVLVNTFGTQLGASIDVLKDQFLSGVTFDNDSQEMTFVFYTAHGETASTVVDLSEAVFESEAGNGLSVSESGMISVKPKEDSTDYQNPIKVGESGVYFDNVLDAGYYA